MHIEQPILENKNELNKSKEKSKDKENEKTSQFTLSRENHQAIIYELEQQKTVEEKTQESKKILSRRRDH